MAKRRRKRPQWGGKKPEWKPYGQEHRRSHWAPAEEALQKISAAEPVKKPARAWLWLLCGCAAAAAILVFYLKRMA